MESSVSYTPVWSPASRRPQTCFTIHFNSGKLWGTDRLTLCFESGEAAAGWHKKLTTAIAAGGVEVGAAPEWMCQRRHAVVTLPRSVMQLAGQLRDCVAVWCLDPAAGAFGTHREERKGEIVCACLLYRTQAQLLRDTAAVAHQRPSLSSPLPSPAPSTTSGADEPLNSGRSRFGPDSPSRQLLAEMAQLVEGKGAGGCKEGLGLRGTRGQGWRRDSTRRCGRAPCLPVAELVGRSSSQWAQVGRSTRR